MKNALSTVFLFGLVLLGATPARAQTPVGSGYASERMYVGVAFLPSFTLDGNTFDGVTIYREENEGDEFGFLPKLDKQNMVRFAAGFRARPGAAPSPGWPRASSWCPCGQAGTLSFRGESQRPSCFRCSTIRARLPADRPGVDLTLALSGETSQRPSFSRGSTCARYSR